MDFLHTISPRIQAKLGHRLLSILAMPRSKWADLSPQYRGGFIVDPDTEYGFRANIVVRTQTPISTNYPLKLRGLSPGLPRYAASVSATELLELLEDDKVLQAEVAIAYEFDVHSSVPACGIVRPSIQPARGLTGDKVLIGIIDSGCDIFHGDFRNAVTGTSRIEAIWDQTIIPTTGEHSPRGYGYGVEYSQNDVNCQLMAPEIPIVRQVDRNGHGTHVAGIAAGNGAAPGAFVGVAPNAGLLIAKSTLLNDNVADAIAYLIAKSAGRPLVINLSLGNHHGPHDGTDDLEMALSTWAEASRNVAIVVASGNSGDMCFHCQGETPARVGTRLFDNEKPVEWTFWFDLHHEVSGTLWAPTGNCYGPVDRRQPLALDATGVVIRCQKLAGCQRIGVTLPAGADIGHWIVELSSETTARYHGWISNYSMVAAFSAADLTSTCTSPGTARRVLTVGAYHHMDAFGRIAVFSGQGPTRDGRVKPDITAPGIDVASALSSTRVPQPDDRLTPDGVHLVLSGTSMSTPHVTGVGARAF